MIQKVILICRCPMRQQNQDYLIYLLSVLYHESWVSWPRRGHSDIHCTSVLYHEPCICPYSQWSFLLILHLDITLFLTHWQHLRWSVMKLLANGACGIFTYDTRLLFIFCCLNKFLQHCGELNLCWKGKMFEATLYQNCLFLGDVW